MTKLRFGPGFAIFLLFFGIATLDAARSANWIRALFWLAIGLVFLTLDNRRGTG